MNAGVPAWARFTTGGPNGDAAGVGPLVVDFTRELRDEGMAVGTSELLDAFDALGAVDWSDRAAFREAMSTTIAKSQEDRALFAAVFDRYFFRATEAEAARAEAGGDGSDRPDGAQREGEDGNPQPGEGGEGQGESQIDVEALREAIMEALENGSDDTLRDLARLAIMTLSGGASSGVVGVDVQRVRRQLELRSQDLPPGAEGEDLRKQLQKFERHVRRELEARMIAETGELPTARPLNELNRALPSGGSQDLAAVHRSVKMLKRAMATQGLEQRGHNRTGPIDVRQTMRASLETGGVPIDLRYRPRRPRRPELYVLCDVSTSVTSASVFFLSILHALHDSFKRLRTFVFIERVAEVTEVFEQERSFKAASEKISNTAGVADISGYTDYGRVWVDFYDQVAADLDPRSTVIVLGDARTNGREPRADLFGKVTEKAGRSFWLNPEPRLYWNYGDSVIGVYENFCDGVFECWTSKQLEDFVRELTAVRGR
ncbi:MAG: VWA domain-containing protein [Thermoleophilaceae bacterium]|nr:VWA domain-containing protein [Thermoleophilaceae bacterium]